MTRKPKIALVMVAVSDLGGSGGAERLFSYLHEYLSARSGVRVAMITAASSLVRLQSAGRLTMSAGVIELALGAHPGRGKSGVAWMTLRLLWATWRGRFDLVHICLPSPIYVPYAAVLSWLPRTVRPRLSLSVIDCTLADSLYRPPPVGTYERQVLDAHHCFARWVRLDGVYSWYEAFVTAVANGAAMAGGPLSRAARYCFTEPDRFRPAAKEKVVIFAGRLSEQKRPLLFVDAVAVLRTRYPELIAGWRFELYGTGILATEVASRIAHHGVDDVLNCHSTADMAPVFARSQLFVSTQAFENFTSLSMLEAMAAGNAVIAEDVGQTREFVRHDVNGLLVRSASADAFADAIAAYLRAPEHHDAMAAESRRLATEVHTIEHFADDITAFWQDVLHR